MNKRHISKNTLLSNTSLHEDYVWTADGTLTEQLPERRNTAYGTLEWLVKTTLSQIKLTLNELSCQCLSANIQ